MGNRLIELQNITKIYDGHKVLDDLNLYFNVNTFLTLLGPSGCGKTTTLRIIGSSSGSPSPGPSSTSRRSCFWTNHWAPWI